MNIGPLFKRFDELADAPERIPALRKVILAYLLHSAVNSPDAISRAATLREAHEVRRRELIKNASRKDVPTVPEVADEDLPPSLSDIPTVLFDRLGNIASIEKGLSQIQSTKPGKYPLVVTAETRSSSESFDFEGAAAIIPLVSSTGHGDASLKRLHFQEGRYAVGNILAVVKPICPDLLRARFIYEYLSAFKEELLVSRMVGTANVSLTVNKLKEVPVPLVSGPVLSRIDELMALCDRLEAQQQERETRHAALARASLARFADAPTPANLNFIFHPSFSVSPADLRKSILTLAVQGKLVPQDPNDEPVEAPALPRATKPRGEREAPFDLPVNWKWMQLGQVSELINGDRSKNYPNKAEYVPEGVAWINTGHIEPDGTLSTERMHFITRKKFDSLRSGKVRPGDLVYCLRGATLGKTAIITQFEEGAVASSLVIIRLANAVDPKFAYRFLTSPLGREQIFQFDNGSAQPNLSANNVKKYWVPLPPLAEQRRIVAKVEQLMALVDGLEQQLASSRATAANLLSALVAELTSAKTAEPRVLMAAEDPGHYGATVKAPDFGVSLALTRATLAAEIVHRMHGDRTFGQIKFQKALYLAEYIPQLAQIDSYPERYQNGPHDPALITEVEAKMKACDWFETVPRSGGNGYEYRPLDKAGDHQKNFEALWPKQAATIRRLIDEMKPWKTERCERFATLYAAWNDLIIWGKPADDAAIMDQVLNHWNTAKQQIPKSSWQEMLSWMKREGYVPVGWGRATSMTPQSELF